jgi:hypothetical protein
MDRGVNPESHHPEGMKITEPRVSSVIILKG